MKDKLRLVGALISLVLLTALSLVTDSAIAGGTPLPEATRPKIGLALGGGSAGGFAHIGVLRWLEENQIPIDYIAGTSMGGLMGGIYAMGMSPDQMKQLVENINWEQLFDSDPPFNTLDFRRKEVLLNYPTGIELGLKDKLLIGNGLSVYRINLLLSRLTLPYSAISNFNELPIPFWCVATDLRNSEEVVLRDGSLSEALRATMSIPGAFVPVEREGRLLVDGGLVNNVPADLAKEMGAEVVIAVNCNETNTNKDMRRLDAILMGSINTIMIENTNRSLLTADIVIHPRSELAYTNWEAIDQFIAAGYQAAAAQGTQLRKWALNEDDWREYLQKRSAARHSQSLIPEAIAVSGTSTFEQAKNIEAQLSVFKGRPIDTDQLDATLIEILGSGLYQSFRYEVIIQDQIPILLITVKENDFGPPYLRFIVETHIIGEAVSLNLRSRITTYEVIGDDSELAVDLAAGTDPGIIAELYKPVTQNGLFVAPRVTWERKRDSYFQDAVYETDFQRTNQSLGIDLGYSINKFCEVRFGYESGRQDVKPIIGSALPGTDGSYDKLSLKWSYLNLDNTIVPRGLVYDLKANWYTEAPGSADDFKTVETSLKWLKPVNPKNTFVTLIGAGATISGAPPLLQQFTLGGPFKVGTYNLNELRGANYFLGTFGLAHSLGKPLGISQVYLCALIENGGVFESWSDFDYTSTVSIGLISNSFFGPIYLGTSFGKADRGRIYLKTGKLF